MPERDHRVCSAADNTDAGMAECDRGFACGVTGRGGVRRQSSREKVARSRRVAAGEAGGRAGGWSFLPGNWVAGPRKTARLPLLH